MIYRQIGQSGLSLCVSVILSAGNSLLSFAVKERSKESCILPCGGGGNVVRFVVFEYDTLVGFSIFIDLFSFGVKERSKES